MRVALALALALPLAVAAPAADLVTDLPGSEGLGLPTMYSGYLDLPSSEKHIFYWFVQASESPETAPLALWTNGGPGCSGLTGFMTEQGPFHIDAEGSPYTNEYAWNTAANMLFVEQPAGVGFSYSDDHSDYTTGDWQAAHDNFEAINVFLSEFPEYAQNDFYLTAESYGGHYLPTLAKYIVDNNDGSIAFKGFAVGNPYTSTVSNQVGEFTTLYGHQVVSKPQFTAWVDDCSAHYAGAKKAELRGEPYDSRRKPYACLTDEEVMLGNIELNLNPYALDFPTCPRTSDGKQIGRGRFGAGQRLALLKHSLADQPRLLAAALASLQGTVGEYVPCTDTYATEYLNRLDVQQALHINGGEARNASTTVRWEECSYSLRYNMSDSRTPMMPNYQYLLDEANAFDLQILVYSGDDDVVCATEGSQEWIYDLGFDVVPQRAWRSWKYDDDTYGRQTGGYTANFETDGMSGRFAFTTAHGCGHEVPTYKPQLALQVFKDYLSGEVFN